MASTLYVGLWAGETGLMVAVVLAQGERTLENIIKDINNDTRTELDVGDILGDLSDPSLFDDIPSTRLLPPPSAKAIAVEANSEASGWEAVLARQREFYEQRIKQLEVQLEQNRQQQQASPGIGAASTPAPDPRERERWRRVNRILSEYFARYEEQF